MVTYDWEALAASISYALNTAQIPCILWGHCLLIVHGVPTIIGSIDFVVPDDLLQAATRVLANLCLENEDSAFTLSCPDSTACSVIAPKRPTPAPSTHRHLKKSDVYVGLYLQRDTLWFLPPLSSMGDILLSPVATNQLPPYFILASDQDVLPPWRPGRSSGFFKPGRSSVVAVKAHILLEAFMRIHARDSGTMAGSFSMAMILYMSMYVDDDGLLDVDQLPEYLKQLYEELQARKRPLRQWTMALKESLRQSP